MARCTIVLEDTESGGVNVSLHYAPGRHPDTPRDELPQSVRLALAAYELLEAHAPAPCTCGGGCSC